MIGEGKESTDTANSWKFHCCLSSLRRSLDAPSLKMMGLKGEIARMKLCIFNPRWLHRIVFLDFQTLLASCGWNICACRVFIGMIWNDNLLQSSPIPFQHYFDFHDFSHHSTDIQTLRLPIWMAKRGVSGSDAAAWLGHWSGLTSEQQTTSRPQIWAVWDVIVFGT